MKQRIIRRTLLALALSAFGASTMAQVSESEPNDSLSAVDLAPLLLVPDSNGTITVTGYIGDPANTCATCAKKNDLDIFKFNGRAGDTLTIDISNAHKGPKAAPLTSLDSYLTLFGPKSTDPTMIDYELLREIDDALSCDANSFCFQDSKLNWVTRDARLDNVKLKHTGTHYIAVTPAGVQFWTLNPPKFKSTNYRSNGAYTLTITGLTPPVVLMHIDIKPGSAEESSPINLASKGNVPVALLGKDFDPFKINVSSLRFGSTGNEESLRRCSNDPVDVDNDGKMDRVCHFDNQAAFVVNTTPPGTEAILTGQMSDGRAFKGTGRLKVLAPKKDD